MSQNKNSSLYDWEPIKLHLDNGVSIEAVQPDMNQGLWAQITQGNTNVFDPYKTLPILTEKKLYLETIELAADLLAGSVITPQEYFKLKLLLKSKDEEVRNTAIIFLNQKAKL
jgi:hypothetical protein